MKIEEFDVQAMVNDIQKENGTISEVYFVACGGSLIDLYSQLFCKQRISIHDRGMDPK